MAGFIPYEHHRTSDRNVYRQKVLRLFKERQPPKISRMVANGYKAWWLIENLNFDGWCLTTDDNPFGIDATHIAEWFIFPESRGHGISYRLWQLRRRITKRPVTVAVHKDNISARTFLVVCRFQIVKTVGDQVVYYHPNN